MVSCGHLSGAANACSANYIMRLGDLKCEGFCAVSMMLCKELKSRSRGYASMDYRILDFRPRLSVCFHSLHVEHAPGNLSWQLCLPSCVAPMPTPI